MSAPVVLRQNFSDFRGADMLPALEEIFMSELQMHQSKRDLLFSYKSPNGGIWQYSEVHDMPLHSETAEGAEYSYQRPNQGASKTLAVSKYGLGASISDEMIRDAKFDVVADIIRKMARSGKESQEIQAMSILNNAFTSSVTADGQALCSTAHTLPSGATFANRPSTDLDLSRTSLDQLMSDFETNFVGDTGIIYTMKPKYLLVHTDSKRYAQELLGSEKQPDSDFNNINSLKDEGVQVISSPHITDTDSWFLLADKQDTGLVIVQDYPIQTKGWEDEDRDAVKYKSRYREKIGATNGYGIIGTTGA